MLAVAERLVSLAMGEITVLRTADHQVLLLFRRARFRMNSRKKAVRSSQVTSPRR